MIDEIEEDARDKETSKSGLIAAVVMGLLVGVLGIWCVSTMFDGGEGDSVYVNLAEHTDTLCPSLMSKVVRVWQAGGRTQEANNRAIRTEAMPFLTRMADRTIGENEARAFVLRCMNEGY